MTNVYGPLFDEEEKRLRANPYSRLFREEEKRLRANPYNQLFSEDAGLSRARLREAARTSPEAYNAGVSQSRATGAPLSVVLRNPKEAASLAKEAQAQKILERYPVLGPLLLNTNTAEVLADDLAPLGLLAENPILRKKPTAADFPIGPNRGFREASEQLRAAQRRYQQDISNYLDRKARLWNDLLLVEEEKKWGNEGVQRALRFAKERPYLASILSGVLSTGSGLWGAIEWATRLLGMDYHAGAANAVQDVANRYVEALQSDISKEHFVDTDSKIDWILTKTLENAPSLVLSLSAILNPALMSRVLGTLSASSGGQQYHKLVEEGVDPNIAATAGVGYAVVEALTERLPIDVGKAVLKRYTSLPVKVQHEIGTRLLYGTAFPVAFGATQGLEEVVAQEAQRWIDAATGGLQLKFGGGGAVGEQLAATGTSLFTKDMIDAFVAGAAGGGLVGSTVGGATAAGLLAAPDMVRLAAEQESAIAKVHAADQYAQNLAAAGQVLSQTKAATLLPAGPEALAKVMEEMDPEGKVVIDANVFAQALEQTSTPLEPILSVSPSIRDQLADARAMKSDLIIPTGEFLAALSTTPAFASLIPHTKPDVNAFSQEEAKAYMLEQAKAVEAEIAKIIERNAANEPFAAGSKWVYDTTLAELERVGRFTTDVNKVYATFVQRFATTFAERLGTTPDAFFNTYQLGYTAEGLAKDGRFDQLVPATLDDFRPGRVGNILNRTRWTILEAGNPMGKADTPENNAAAMARLKAILDERGLEYVDTIGRYGNVAPGVLVLGITEDDAVELGRMFDQESVLIRSGLGYGDGTLNPTTGVVEEITPGPDDDYYTTIPSLGTSFRVGIDFSTRVPRSSNTLDQSVSIRSGRETLKKYGLHPNVTYTVRQVAAALEARQRAKYGSIDAKDRSEEAVKKIAKWMTEEVLFELENPGRSGVGWYSYKFQRALDKFGEVFPELLTDQTARDIFTLFIAITSDGAVVTDNARMAVNIYSNYRETGKVELKGGHHRDLDDNLKLAQKLIDTKGAKNVGPYLLQEATVRDLRAFAKENGFKFNTEYTADTVLPLSAVLLGPKLGAFYANLMGSHGYLTMDRWWSRTFNRYRGILLTSPTKASLERFRNLINKPWLTDDEVLAEVVPYRNAYKAKGYKNGTEIEKAANTIYKAAFENLNDAPFNGSDRSFMIAAAKEAQKMLKRRGHDISIADIQAILWYYEKKLYGELGAREPGGVDYEEAAQRIVEEYSRSGDLTGRSATRSFAQDPDRGLDPGLSTFETEPGVLNQESREPLDNIVGIHFSPAKRDVLDGQYYGRGAAGAERRRVMAAQDKRLRERVHFYVSTGQGVFPESGVGDVAHLSVLDNLYDADADPLNLFRGSSDEALNAAESAVIDEGYSGYLSRKSFGRQGTVVLLGPGSRDVDTEVIGGLAEANARAVVPPEPKYSEAKKLALELKSLAPKLPAGEIGVAEWRKHLARVAPDLLPQIEATGALEKITAPAYLSEIIGNIYRQDEEGPRGQIRFGDDITQQRTIISILQGADLSTVLHELGHFYFEVTRDVANKIVAKRARGEQITPGEQSILDDMDALLEFIGVEPSQQLSAGGQAGTLDQTAKGKTPRARAKAQGFDVNDTLYHWRARDLDQFRAFSHFGTKNAADDRYMMPAGPGKTYQELLARHKDGLPAEGAVYPVWINKSKVLHLAEDTGSHDVFNLAFSIGKATNNPGLLDSMIEATIRGMREDQLLEWADENGYYYLTEEEDFPTEWYRDVIREEYKRGYGSYRGTDGSMQDNNSLVKFANKAKMEKVLLDYLADRGITALSYVNEVEDPGSISWIVPDPRNVRSIHANFEGSGQFSMLDQGGETGETPVLPPGATRLDVWNSMSFEQRRAGHEKIARAFEAYLFKGKAPTQELTSIFQRIAAWMLDVYKSIKALGVELTPQVEEVFDRWLASETAIEETRTVRNSAPLFNTKPPGMTDAEWAEYQNKVADSAGIEEAQDQLRARSLRNLRWVNNRMSREVRRLRKDAAAKRRQIRAEVEEEVYKEPVYAAERFLRRGILPGGDQVVGAKLDLDALREMYGDEPNAIWRYFPTGKYGLVGAEGMHPDAVAEIFGFDSGDALVRALLAAEPVQSVIEGMTDQRMLERYGDLADERAIQRAAEAAVHNDARGAFIATEMNALAKMIGRPRIMAKAAQEFAAVLIGRKRLRDIRPAQFEAAEVAAAKRAEKALAADKLIEAATEKRNQLVNFYAAKAAHEALEARDKALRYLKKFGNRNVRKRIDSDALEQIDGILDTLDLRRLTQREMDDRASLRDWIESQKQAGFEPVADPDLVERISRKPFDELTVEEMQGLVDSVKNIEHLGRRKKALHTVEGVRHFEEQRDALAESIVRNANRTVEQSIEFNTAGERVKHLWRKFAAAHRKIASRAREMDGGKTGLFWELIVRPMNHSGDKESVMREEAAMKLAALFDSLGLGSGWSKKMQVPGTNFSLSREGRIMVVLNMGNEGNRQRLRDGGLDGKTPLTEQDLQAILDTLTKEEMDFVQGVWDLLESYRPQVAAQEKRLTGLVPKWIDATPVNTRYGVYRGGYFPAKYEGRLSFRSAALEAATDLRQSMLGLFGVAATRSSYTKERADEVKGRPLRKDFGVIAEHLNEVIHRLSWQDFLTDATRLLNDRKIDAAIREHYGEEVLTDLRDTLVDLAKGDMQPRGVVDRIIRHLRVGTSIAGMGWNVVTGLLQPSGVSQSIKRIGAEWFTKGLNEYASDPNGKIEEVFSKSDMMRLRAKTMQREINEILNTVRVGKTISGVQGSYFWLIAKMQLQVDMPTWLGAYQRALFELQMENAATAEERARIENKARDMADQAVLDSQGGGQWKDLAAVQRGSEGLRLFTNFYSYFNVTHNLAAVSYRTESAWQLPATFLLLFTIPALYSVALKEILKGECEWDTECLAEKLIRENLSYMFGTMLFFREIGSALQGFTGYHGPAGTRFFSEAAKLTRQVEQGEVDITLVKAAIMTTSIPLHLPGTAISRAVEGTTALAEDETDNILAPLVGVPRP